MKSKGIIYKVTNLINNKIYIGKTITTLDNRRKNHLYCAKSQKTYFYNSLIKYGFNNFKWEVIFDSFYIEYLNEAEKYFISYYNSKLPNEYNMTDGGDGAPYGDLNPSKREDVRKKLRFKLSGKNNPRYGISPSNKGVSCSKEQKEKLRISNIGKIRGPKTIEQKINISIGRLKNKEKYEGKIFEILSPKNEIFITGELHKFCLENRLPHKEFRRLLRDKHSKSYKNWKIKLINSKENII